MRCDYFEALHIEMHVLTSNLNTRGMEAVFEENLSITNQDPSDSKSNRLHVDIFRVFLHEFEVYSIDPSKMTNKFREVLIFNWWASYFFLELNQFICN